MEYKSVKEKAEEWNISEREVRWYCLCEKIDGAKKENNKWIIPDESSIPFRLNKADSSNILKELRKEKKNQIKGRLYHRIQIDMTYNSNHIEGSTLTFDQTKYIFETQQIDSSNGPIKVNDIVETVNHFKCIDKVIDNANYPLTESFIKELHRILKTNTSDSFLPYFNVGEYKRLSNTIGVKETISPKKVKEAMKKLLDTYNLKEKHSFKDIIDFHYEFESIHPFQDGNGRVGRLIILKECLKNNIVPPLIKDEHKLYYYRGLSEYKHEPGYLIGTMENGQDEMEKLLNLYNIRK